MSGEFEELRGTLRNLEELNRQQRQLQAAVWQLLARTAPELRPLILRTGLDEQGAARWVCSRNAVLRNATPACRVLAGHGHEVAALVLRVLQGIETPPTADRAASHRRVRGEGIRSGHARLPAVPRAAASMRADR